MQESRRKSPISMLNEDVLWKIFMLNTEFDRYSDHWSSSSPLIIARRCSQACRQWRSMLLSSPLIWGRLIDLRALRQKKDDWRKEVEARSEGALLWVYGCISPELLPDFLFPFLHKNWGRVQILYLWHQKYHQYDDKLWAFLNEPAPYLQKFEAQVPNHRTSLPSNSLFADNAPVLRHFCGYTNKFPTDASWLRNLSSMTFSSVFTTDEVLQALKRTPNLVSLTISTQYDYDYDSAARNQAATDEIVLSKLGTLTLEGSFLGAGTILQRITPSPDYNLSTTQLEFRHIASEGHVGEYYYAQYEEGIKSYLLPHFSVHPPSSVKIQLIRENALVLESANLNSHTGQFSIELYTPSLSSSSLIKELISSASFSSATKLQIRFGAWSMPTPTSALGIVSLLEAFPSVKTLITSDAVLYSLLQHPDRTARLFPSLTTLDLTDSPSVPSDLSSESGSHECAGDPSPPPPPSREQFLKLRKDAGWQQPVTVLLLSTTPDNIRLLQRGGMVHYESEYPGLLVKCSAEEYLCGSGQPEKLRFEAVANDLRATKTRLRDMGWLVGARWKSWLEDNS
ncbi:hypothetical protein D9613_006611 [Agrocybe pediades]|uniref:F-box domain-containing protein n=1 Tax=Agrocybe pediades TaxID=84607 RepID=A0A8H4QGQ1_9AGAR|nr:hypothetical protein D9613_006611 [Agrocybe pediades]